MADHPPPPSVARQQVRVLVGPDLGAVVRVLQPAVVLGLRPSTVTIEEQGCGLAILMEFASPSERDLQLLCDRLAASPAVIDVTRWAAN